MAPHNAIQIDLCACCNEPCRKKRCSRCLVVSYCSRECQVKHYPEHKPFCLLHVKDLAQWDGAVMSNPADSAMKEDLRRLQDVFTDEFLHYGRSALKLGHPGACAHTHLLRVSFGYFSSGTELRTRFILAEATIVSFEDFLKEAENAQPGVAEKMRLSLPPDEVLESRRKLTDRSREMSITVEVRAVDMKTMNFRQILLKSISTDPNIWQTFLPLSKRKLNQNWATGLINSAKRNLSQLTAPCVIEAEDFVGSEGEEALDLHLALLARRMGKKKVMDMYGYTGSGVPFPEVPAGYRPS